VTCMLISQDAKVSFSASRDARLSIFSIQWTADMPKFGVLAWFSAVRDAHLQDGP